MYLNFKSLSYECAIRLRPQINFLPFMSFVKYPLRILQNY